MEHGSHSAEDALDSFAGNFAAPDELWPYCSGLVRGIAAHGEEIDRLLNQASRRWRTERMPRVDRNILRLACFEMLFSQGGVPAKVAINEAVELAKRYGGKESPAFVNAVLDSLMCHNQSGSASSR